MAAGSVSDDWTVMTIVTKLVEKCCGVFAVPNKARLLRVPDDFFKNGLMEAD